MTVELRHLRAFLAIAAEGTITRAGTWPLRIGHAWSALGEHTTPLLRLWKQEHPDTPVQLLRVDDRLAGLGHGTVDVAVIRGEADLPAEVDTVLLLFEARVAAVAADSPLTRKARLTLHDLVAEPIAVNTIAGTATLDLWPADDAPNATVEVANTDDWIAAIAAGHAVGVTTTATAATYPNPAVTYLPLIDVPAVPVHLTWRQPPSHPAVPDLVNLARRLLLGERTRSRAAAGIPSPP
ncbi:LysR substrate-binding domain-containing protein [Actinoplanes awajinensis]|uniref:LysR substrate-binding domain-containing protein n=1 Tax=Actinoplanes awajinensis subsp. mycoplanecinus TaxID=135947 RepID=A0A0X3V9L5_9ACTN|nr:LysR substrate-binding domain-containing protein [Actinoplanes awajinensis]KUL41471.1 hypothetical protein ADL15_04250 [Actinoplanes awajinensis subsp. mycoplanecinus]